jgi:membrane associated rhomboid family serine protease
MAMNLTILLALGRFAADRYGPASVLTIFLSGALAGGAAFGALSRGGFPMVGASGAVFAFLGVWIAWDWRRHRSLGAPVGPVLRRIAVLAGLNVVLYFGLGGMLAWEAHLGGCLAGLALGTWDENRHASGLRMARAEARRRDAVPRND